MRVSLHVAPTGSGKSYGISQVAVAVYRQGGRCLVAVPTIKAAGECEERLKTMAPDAFAGSAVAIVCGHRRDFDFGSADETTAGRPDDADSTYPIHEWTGIVICSHAQLGRRGFSRFMRAIWRNLGSKADAPAFSLVLDEVQEFIQRSRWEIPLAHRRLTRRFPDGSGGSLVPVRDCPRQNYSGNCGNCTLVPGGGELRFNAFNIREVGSPRTIELDATGNPLRQPRSVVTVTNEDVGHGEKTRVANTVWAASLTRYRDVSIDPDNRAMSLLWLFRKNQDGQHPPETIEEILSHQLRFSFRPTLVWEHPVDADGQIVRSDTLAARIARGQKDWDRDIVFPRLTCEAPRLLFTDLSGLEQMRRFLEVTGASLAFAGATLGPDNLDILRTVWSDIVLREYPYPDRKILQCAVVFIDNRTSDEHRGLSAFVAADHRLVTASLEEIGIGLYFAPTFDVARSIYHRVRHTHPTANFIEGNDEVEAEHRNSAHHLAEEARVWITYSRGIMGVGANIPDLRYLVVDANTFRYVAGFNPAEITPESFARTLRRGAAGPGPPEPRPGAPGRGGEDGGAVRPEPRRRAGGGGRAVASVPGWCREAARLRPPGRRRVGG